MLADLSNSLKGRPSRIKTTAITQILDPAYENNAIGTLDMVK